ncbi:hypothetical protein H4W79_003903 [Nocardiopsis terrae]|uniref:Uncharacterized protein n=1 Tax=Nocardiopsis terrae TaxID=372655 RepID=A0ABR9HL00_9ACTN|nr:hypothetical protein [Nocardiopsis terrae]
MCRGSARSAPLNCAPDSFTGLQFPRFLPRDGGRLRCAGPGGSSSLRCGRSTWTRFAVTAGWRLSGNGGVWAGRSGASLFRGPRARAVLGKAGPYLPHGFWAFGRFLPSSARNAWPCRGRSWSAVQQPQRGRVSRAAPGASSRGGRPPRSLRHPWCPKSDWRGACCFRSRPNRRDLATRGNFGAEVAPGSKITVKRGSKLRPERAEGRMGPAAGPDRGQRPDPARTRGTGAGTRRAPAPATRPPLPVSRQPPTRRPWHAGQGGAPGAKRGRTTLTRAVRAATIMRRERGLFGSSALRLFGSSALRLFGSSALRLFGSSALRLFGSSALRLFGSSARSLNPAVLPAQRLPAPALRRPGPNALPPRTTPRRGEASRTSQPNPGTGPRIRTPDPPTASARAQTGAGPVESRTTR